MTSTYQQIACRTLTGAWIETTPAPTSPCRPPVAPSRVRGLKQCTYWAHEAFWRVAPSRVRGLKLLPYENSLFLLCRTLTGAWIETPVAGISQPHLPVAPSRVRGLKQEVIQSLYELLMSHPHGCVD